MRDCNKCIHHTSGSCSSFDCKMQTVEDVVKESRDKAITGFVERLNQYKYGRTNGIYIEIPLYKLDEIASEMRGAE